MLEDGEVLKRNDQLTNKAQHKAKRRRGGKGKKAKKNKRSKKGKKGKAAKTKASSSHCISPTKRKRDTLRKARAQKEDQKPGGQEVVGAKPKGKGKTPKTHQPSGKSVEEPAQAANPNKRRAKRKATSEDDRIPKPKRAPKAKAQPKTAAAKKKAMTKHGILHDQEKLTDLFKFAYDFDPNADHKTDIFKNFLRSQIGQPQDFGLNIYWTSASCGVKDKKAGKDIHSFTFHSIPAPHNYRLAVAVRCAEIAAPRLHKNIYTGWFIECLNYPNWSLVISLYIICFTIPCDFEEM